MEKNVVVDMTNFDMDSEMDELIRKRYSMPPHVIAALKQAGQLAAMRLLQLVGDDKKFDKLRPTDQLKVMEMIFDRAYGKSESASSNELASLRIGDANGGDKSDHAKQLEAIEARAAKRLGNARRLPSPSGSTSGGSVDVSDVEPDVDSIVEATVSRGGSMDDALENVASVFPELGIKSKRATREGGGNRAVTQRNVVALRRRS